MMLLTETEIKMLGETILEALDAKIAPIIEKVEKIERQERIGQPELENFRESLRPDFQAIGGDITRAIGALTTFKDDTGKKFNVTAKLIESAMNALEQTTRAKKCEDDVKGLALLKGVANNE